MKVKIKIIDSHGKKGCPMGHVIGDEFVTDGKTPEGLCCSAFNSIWPYAKTLLATQDRKFEGTVVCPDGDVILEYELSLID